MLQLKALLNKVWIKIPLKIPLRAHLKIQLLENCIENRITLCCVCFALGIILYTFYGHIGLLALLCLIAWFFGTFFNSLFCILILFIAAGFTSIKLKVEWIKSRNQTQLPLKADISAYVQKVENNKVLISNIALNNDCSAVSKIHINLPKRAVMYVKDANQINKLKNGDIIQGAANFYEFAPPLLPSSYDQRFYAFFDHLQAKGTLNVLSFIPSSQIMLQDHIKRALIYKLKDQADLALAIWLNDRSMISKKVKNDFNICGFGHILAISGLHLLILGNVIGFCVNMLFKLHIFRPLISKIAPILIKRLISLLLVLFYVFLTGAGFSVLRAYIMLVINFYIWGLDRNIKTNDVLHLTALLIMIIMPESIFYPSFQLSFICVLGFCFLPKKAYLQNIKKKKNAKLYLIEYLKQGLYITLILNAISFPITIFHFKQISLQPFTTNILLMPYVSIIFIPSVFLCFLLPASVVYYQTLLLKWIIAKLSFFAVTWSGFTLPSSAVGIYCLTISFLCTNLRLITYTGWIIMMMLTLLNPKIVAFIDPYGRSAVKENNNIFVNSHNQRFIDQAHDLWGKEPIYRRANVILNCDKYTKNIVIYDNGTIKTQDEKTWFE